ncbi:MAG: ABC transporter permease, partial [Planctomycetota bacterium]
VERSPSASERYRKTRPMRQLPFQYAFRNLGRSRVRLTASLVGSSLVVILILASGGFVRGMQLTLSQSVSIHENVMILGTGSEEGVERSQIDASIEGIAAASIRGLKERAGVIYASPEIHAALPVRESLDSTTDLNAVMRGVRPVALLVHPTVEITEGRPPRQGQDELMVGELAATRLGIPHERLAIDNTLYFDDREWTIVGHFSAPNTVMNAEIWLPLTDLQIATNRESSLSCVIVTLESAQFASVDMFSKSRLDLEISAIREQDYYASIAEFYAPIRIMIIVTAILIASGGILGGLNTMYAAFAARVREIGMLQSLGFTRAAIVSNLAEESVFSAACGAIIGSLIALLLLDGLAVRFSMGAFALTMDAPIVLVGILGGLAVGIAGAIPPTVRCLRLPITQALKSH